jgi:hypothetical protein
MGCRPRMLFDDERSLAWALAEATTPHLSTAQLNDLHVAIGVGETFAAIRCLLTSAADKRITLPPELVQGCTRWLAAYAGHEDEWYLRGLVERAGSIDQWSPMPSRRIGS